MWAPAVIFDLDCTLADTEHLMHLVESGDYDEYHRRAFDARTIPWAVECFRTWVSTNYFRGLVVTARSEKYRSQTLHWLREHNVRFSELLMRPLTDERPDDEVKWELLESLGDQYRFYRAYDDSPAVCAMYESRGIPTVQMPRKVRA